MSEIKKETLQNEEKLVSNPGSGMAMLFINILLMLASVAGIIIGGINLENGGNLAIWVIVIIVSGIYLTIIGPVLFIGLKILKPNEALVLTLFGKYYGTLKEAGFYFVNPFASATNPAAGTTEVSGGTFDTSAKTVTAQLGLTAGTATLGVSKKISLKNMTLNNEKQKVNDLLGNPIEVGIVVIWRVVNTAKAVFNVDNYKGYLSIQCDSALRNIARLYPYDTPSEDGEKSIRGSSQEIADKLKLEIQEKVDIAGLEIIEAKITRLAYAPEIAAAMLQRQQASAVVDAKQKIVEGAVGMVEMALNRLSENNIVQLDDERKAAMVSNLLVVLCGNRETQPVINSGSLY